MHLTRFRRLIFSIHTVRGKMLMSLIDAETSEVISTQMHTRPMTELEVMERADSGIAFNALAFGDKSHHVVRITEEAVGYIDCERANEPLLGN